MNFTKHSNYKKYTTSTERNETTVLKSNIVNGLDADYLFNKNYGKKIFSEHKGKTNSHGTLSL